MRRISAAITAAARAEPREAVMRPSSESSLSAPRSRRTSLSVICPERAALRGSPPDEDDTCALHASTAMNIAAPASAIGRAT